MIAAALNSPIEKEQSRGKKRAIFTANCGGKNTLKNTWSNSAVSILTRGISILKNERPKTAVIGAELDAESASIPRPKEAVCTYP